MAEDVGTVQAAHLANIDKLRQLYRMLGEFPYIKCKVHGTMLLTADEYDRQMDDADSRWACPHCGADCWWVGGELDKLDY